MTGYLSGSYATSEPDRHRSYPAEGGQKAYDHGHHRGESEEDWVLGKPPSEAGR